MNRKYLIIKGTLGTEVVVSFTATVDHAYMTQNFRVVSAGTFNIYPACPPSEPNPQVSVTHGSTTLKIERDSIREEEDQMLIELHLRPEY